MFNKPKNYKLSLYLGLFLKWKNYLIIRFQIFLNNWIKQFFITDSDLYTVIAIPIVRDIKENSICIVIYYKYIK